MAEVVKVIEQSEKFLYFVTLPMPYSRVRAGVGAGTGAAKR
jgi:hypothetical protein